MGQQYVTDITLSAHEVLLSPKLSTDSVDEISKPLGYLPLALFTPVEPLIRDNRW